MYLPSSFGNRVIYYSHQCHFLELTFFSRFTISYANKQIYFIFMAFVFIENFALTTV